MDKADTVDDIPRTNWSEVWNRRRFNSAVDDIPAATIAGHCSTCSRQNVLNLQSSIYRAMQNRLVASIVPCCVWRANAAAEPRQAT